MQLRITKVRDAIISQKLDAILITDQYNVSYLTGFAGLSPNEREGYLFITKTNARLLTFSTYYEMYKSGGDGFDSVCITLDKRLNHHLSEIIDKEKIKTVGYEEDSLTVSELLSLQKKIPEVWKETTGIVESMRSIKDKSETDAIRHAAKVTDDTFEYIKGKIKKGTNERKLALEIEFYIKSHAQDVAFSPIVAFDQNAAIPHYLPSHNSQLTAHNLILLDFGAKVDGYCSDMTRVVFYGTPNPSWIKLYSTVLTAQEKALSVLKPGIKACDADAVSRNFIAQKGFIPYQHGLGHGVGLAIHEMPKLRPGVEDGLMENMVVTVEPGIYLPGEAGVRIEDLVVLTKNGVEVLSKSNKEITVI